MKKLRHALYAVLNASEPDSSDYRIANYLIENIYRMQRFGIRMWRTPALSPNRRSAAFAGGSAMQTFCP